MRVLIGFCKRPTNTFTRGGTLSTPGTAHGGDIRSLRAGIVAKGLLGGDAVFWRDAQVHHQRICFFVESELGSRHKLVSLSDDLIFTMLQLAN